MPIQPDTVQATLDFKYTYEDAGGGGTYYVKFHHVNGVPTLSISDDGQEYVSFPAVMFVDVSEFLRKQGVVGRTNTPPVQNQIPMRGAPLSTVASTADDAAPTALPIPSSGGTIGMDSTMGPVNSNEPLQTFSGLGGLVANISSQGVSSEESQQMVSRPVIRGDTSHVPNAENERAIKSNHQ